MGLDRAAQPATRVPMVLRMRSAGLKADSRRFWIGVAVMATLHAALIAGFVRSAPRYVGEPEGKPRAASASSWSMRPIWRAHPRCVPWNRRPGSPAALRSATAAGSARCSAAARAEGGDCAARGGGTVQVRSRHRRQGQPSGAEQGEPSRAARQEQARAVARSQSLAAVRSARRRFRSRRALRGGHASAQRDAIGRERRVRTRRHSRFAQDHARPARHARPSDGQAAAVRDRQPYPAQLVRSSGDPILDQNVVFAARQSSFPIPPAGATLADRTFLVTYIYR